MALAPRVACERKMLRLGRAFMRAAAFISFRSRGGWCEVPETGEISKCSVALALRKIARPYARASRQHQDNITSFAPQ